MDSQGNIQGLPTEDPSFDPVIRITIDKGTTLKSLKTTLDDPPEGVDIDEYCIFRIADLFRSALLVLDPDARYRLDITKRPEQDDGLPH